MKRLGSSFVSKLQSTMDNRGPGQSIFIPKPVQGGHFCGMEHDDDLEQFEETIRKLQEELDCTAEMLKAQEVTTEQLRKANSVLEDEKAELCKKLDLAYRSTYQVTTEQEKELVNADNEIKNVGGIPSDTEDASLGKDSELLESDSAIEMEKLEAADEERREEIEILEERLRETSDTDGTGCKEKQMLATNEEVDSEQSSTCAKCTSEPTVLAQLEESYKEHELTKSRFQRLVAELREKSEKAEEEIEHLKDELNSMATELATEIEAFNMVRQAALSKEKELNETCNSLAQQIAEKDEKNAALSKYVKQLEETIKAMEKEEKARSNMLSAELDNKDKQLKDALNDIQEMKKTNDEKGTLMNHFNLEEVDPEIGQEEAKLQETNGSTGASMELEASKAKITWLESEIEELKSDLKTKSLHLHESVEELSFLKEAKKTQEDEIKRLFQHFDTVMHSQMKTCEASQQQENIHRLDNYSIAEMENQLNVMASIMKAANTEAEKHELQKFQLEEEIRKSNLMNEILGSDSKSLNNECKQLKKSLDDLSEANSNEMKSLKSCFEFDMKSLTSNNELLQANTNVLIKQNDELRDQLEKALASCRVEMKKMKLARDTIADLRMLNNIEKERRRTNNMYWKSAASGFEENGDELLQASEA